MANRTKLTAERKAVFLEALRNNGGHVGNAAKKVRCSRVQLYAHKQTDKAFAEAWDAAIDASTAVLEDEAIRRATQGTKRPIYQGKELVGHVTEYSNTLLIFMLKARRPDVYRESFKHEHGGPGGGPIPTHTTHAVDLSKLSDDELAVLRGIAARQTGGE